MTQTFQDWSASWKKLKDRVGSPSDIEDVLKEWKNHPPSHALGRMFPDKVGSRKNYQSPVGEQVIELQLLGPPGATPQAHLISGSSVSNLAVCGIFNNFAAAKLKGTTKGQVIADAFGILRVGRKFHPISIEVKVDDGNCWRAVVQNLQQVKFFRSAGGDFRRRLLKYRGEFVPDGAKLEGVWGMVLAPERYWREKPLFAEANALLKRLTGPSDARVLLASIDQSGNIRLVGGHKFL